MRTDCDMSVPERLVAEGSVPQENGSLFKCYYIGKIFTARQRTRNKNTLHGSLSVGLSVRQVLNSPVSAHRLHWKSHILRGQGRFELQYANVYIRVC